MRHAIRGILYLIGLPFAILAVISIHLTTRIICGPGEPSDGDRRAVDEFAMILRGAYAAGTPFPGHTGYITGTCGCPVEEAEWDAGWRTCEDHQIDQYPSGEEQP